jgi:multidrug transporter EmrE-like cation transporter
VLSVAERSDKAVRWFTVPALPGFSVINDANTRVYLQGENEMNAVKLLAIVLIVAGTLGLMYGGFTYTKDTQTAQLGSLELSIKDTETVNVPIWAGVGAIVAGGILLLVRK